LAAVPGMFGLETPSATVGRAGTFRIGSGNLPTGNRAQDQGR
jgi:hypothetical protein